MGINVATVITAIAVMYNVVFVNCATKGTVKFSRVDDVFLNKVLSVSSATVMFGTFGSVKLLRRGFANVILKVLIVRSLITMIVVIILSALTMNGRFRKGRVLRDVLGLTTFLVF